MTKFFFNFKKLYFWHIFGPFLKFLEQEKFSSKNLALSHTTSEGFLPQCQNLQKSNDPIP